MTRRFAAGERPESFDKDFVRSWVTARCDPYRDPIPAIPDDLMLATAASTSRRSRRSPARSSFIAPIPGTPPLARIRANLRRYF